MSLKKPVTRRRERSTISASRSFCWLLFEHYKIDPSDEQSWQKLAMSLAFARR